MKREQFITSCFIALLVFVVIQIFLIFSPFLNAMLWAAILAFGFFPLYRKLQTRMPENDTLSSILMTLFVFLIVVPPLVLVMINLTTQAIEIYQHIKDYIRDGRLEGLVNRIRSISAIQKIESNVLEWEPLKEKTSEWLLNSSRAVANFSVAQVGRVTKNIFFVILNLVLAFFLLCIFLKDGKAIYSFIYQIVPMEEANKKSIFEKINATLSAVIRGQILTSLTQSLVSGAIFWILGVPGPIFLAFATFFTSLIPVLGTWSIWLPVSAFLWVSHHHVKASILFVLGVGFISVIDNVIKPAFIGEKTKLPYFLLFFGMLGGLKLYGIMGVFFAPVVLSLFFALIQIYQETYRFSKDH
ncbi:MAG: AI-2E family transporter [Candidatus Omnitrophica bacterium]|nr:AI-2E family transporter [Candidatus Omnitrophota bacterium]